MDSLQLFSLAFILSYKKVYSRENYVYAYLDPRKPGIYTFNDITFDFEPFYIGRGKNYRMNSHMSPGQMKRETNLKKKHKIEKILSENLSPIIKIIYKDLDLVKSEIIEIQLINIIGRNDLNKGPLTNLTDGGDGCTCVIQSQETRMKKSKALKGRKRIGFKLSEEGRIKKSEQMKLRMKNYKMSEETKQKLSKSKHGKPNKVSKKYMFISPDNEIFFTDCLHHFMRCHDISSKIIYDISSGKNVHIKRWKSFVMDENNNPIIPVKKEKIKKPYIVTEKMIKAWKKGAETRTGVKLSKEHKEKLRNTKKIYTEDSLRRMKEGGLKKYKLTSPLNEEIFPYNLRQYCKDNKLNYTALIGLSTKRVLDYKGWKCEKLS